MAIEINAGGSRSVEQLKQHYYVEKELASRLRHASRQERQRLYASLYDELFRRVPDHPMLTEKASLADRKRAVASQMRLLQRFLNRDGTFLEIGPGDCALSFAVARLVKKVYAVDVSAEITKNSGCPKNFELILSDGRSIDVPPHSVTVAYSYQLMEHLHPDDALEQLQNVCHVLAPRGVYICITPNRLNGPHDISQHFDEIASGFHLKEYTTSELNQLFRKAGFSKVSAYIAARGVYLKCPLFLLRWLENLLGRLPHSWRKANAYILPFRVLLPVRLVGRR